MSNTITIKFQGRDITFTKDRDKSLSGYDFYSSTSLPNIRIGQRRFGDAFQGWWIATTNGGISCAGDIRSTWKQDPAEALADLFMKTTEELLKDYSKELGLTDTTLTVVDLIESHRFLRQQLEAKKEKHHADSSKP